MKKIAYVLVSILLLQVVLLTSCSSTKAVQKNFGVANVTINVDQDGVTSPVSADDVVPK